MITACTSLSRSRRALAASCCRVASSDSATAHRCSPLARSASSSRRVWQGLQHKRRTLSSFRLVLRSCL